MTRLSTPLELPPTPRSVVFGELAAAAGVAGQSVGLVYQDFPGPALGEMWKHFAHGLESGEVVHVRTQADVRRLNGRVAEVRLVLVHNPRLHDAVTWCIQMAQPVPGEIEARPTVFTRGVPDGLDADPGVTLVLRCDSDESAAITQWSILAGQSGPGWENFHTPTQVRMNPALVPLMALNSSSTAGGVRCIRDRHVFQGLLTGAGLRRSCGQQSWTGESVDVNLQDYELVRRLLQSRLVASADAPVDRMAVAMVNRADTFLTVKYGPDQTDANPFPADEYYDRDGPITESPRRPLVTRREIADLGNIHSGMVRRLIEQLQRRSDGFELFGRMGLARRPPNRDDWSRTAASPLTGLLRSWTVKQVRTQFERLYRSGLITAERHPRSGPWRYLLPEEFNGTGSAFADLPPVEQLAPDHPSQAAG